MVVEAIRLSTLASVMTSIRLRISLPLPLPLPFPKPFLFRFPVVGSKEKASTPTQAFFIMTSEITEIVIVAIADIEGDDVEADDIIKFVNPLICDQEYELKLRVLID